MKMRAATILFFAATAAFLAAAFQPIAEDDFLEPSIQNEVDHALARAPSNTLARSDWPEDFAIYCATNDFFKTNNLSKSAIAIRLVSIQHSDGKWYDGTNDVSNVAIEILESLL